nr:MAG TPA: hypothetical protein [Caudoviricetes sp.]
MRLLVSYFYHIYLLSFLPPYFFYFLFPIPDKLENLFKVEVLPMTHLLGYIAASDVTEWYANLPSHIKKEKVISITNINQGFWFEYCNLDLTASCVRVGGKGNFASVTLNSVKVLVAYFT